MTTYVINADEGQMPVQIEYPGTSPLRVETVFIQPKSKAKIPAGSRVPPNFMQLFPSISVKTVDEVGEPVVEAPAPAPVAPKK